LDFIASIAKSIILAIGSLLCLGQVAAAEKISDLGLTNYLHHRLGFHDYFYGPGGVVPRYTGLPAQPRTQKRYARRVTPQRVARFEEFNLSVSLPSNQW
jgi:hypothetical protein